MPIPSTRVPAAPSLFVAAHPLVPRATFIHSNRDGQPDLCGASTACYELFGEGSFEPTSSGAPVFIGRMEQFRDLLRLADPTPCQGHVGQANGGGAFAGLPDKGSGTAIGLAVHKCGSYFVLDQHPRPSALGPPVARGPPEKSEFANLEGVGSCGLAEQQSLPVVPFVTLEEILFGEQPQAVIESPPLGGGEEGNPDLTGGAEVLDGGCVLGGVHTEDCETSAASSKEIGDQGSTLSAPADLPNQNKEVLPVPSKEPAALTPLGMGWRATQSPVLRVTVRNTFLDVVDPLSDEENLCRTHSAPAALDRQDGSVLARGASFEAQSYGSTASSWAVVPWREARSLPWDLRQLLRLTDSLPTTPLLTPSATPPKTSPRSTMAPSVGARVSLMPPLQLPVQALNAPLRRIVGDFPCALRWSFGEFPVLVGCARASEMQRWGLNGLPGATGRLDAWLAETLEGAMQFGTADLSTASLGDREGSFDPEPLMEQGRHLLHFLRLHCQREGGTYLLLRDISGGSASGECQLFDLTPPDDAAPPPGLGGLTLCLRRGCGAGSSPTLAVPLAHLCLRLAGQCDGEDRCRLLQKGLSLLEPTRMFPENRLLYAKAAVSLAVLRMAEQPVESQGIDTAVCLGEEGLVVSEDSATARSLVALWYLEECLRLLAIWGKDSGEDDGGIGVGPESFQCDSVASGDVTLESCEKDRHGEDAIKSSMGTNCTEVQFAHGQPNGHQSAVPQKYLSVCHELCGENGRVRMDPVGACSEVSSVVFGDGGLEGSGTPCSTDLLTQVLMYYATVIVKITRKIGRIARNVLFTDIEACHMETAACAIVQLIWLCRAQLSLQSAVQQRLRGVWIDSGPLALLERELLELMGDAFSTLAATHLSVVPWPMSSACEKFSQALRSIEGNVGNAGAGTDRRDAMLLSQLNTLNRGVWDDRLAQHKLIAHPVSGTGAMRRAYDMYDSAATIGRGDGSHGTSGDAAYLRSPCGPVREAALQVKRARTRRTLAAAAFVDGTTEKAETLLRESFDLASQSGDSELECAILLDAAEIRARHAETLAQVVLSPHDGSRLYFFSTEQYAEYCRSLELLRASFAGSGNRLSEADAAPSCKQAALELKLGVHLFHFADVQDKLVENGQDGSLSHSVDAYGGALAGIGHASSVWLSRARGRNIADLALEHLQRALRLYEGNGEETAGVHFHLAEAYGRQLQTSSVNTALSVETLSARRAMAMRHAEKAAASFQTRRHWLDACVAHRKLAELRCAASETGRSPEQLAAEAFVRLVEAEAKLRASESSMAESVDIANAVSELRAGMADIVREALRIRSACERSDVSGLRDLYRSVLRREDLSLESSCALLPPSATALPSVSWEQAADVPSTARRRRLQQRRGSR